MFLLSTDSLKGYGLNRVFDFAKGAGFGGIELALDARDFDTQNVDYVKQLQEKSGVSVSVVRTFPNSNPKKALLALNVAKGVGANTVVLEPPKFFDFSYKKWMRDEAPGLRKKYGIQLALKNGPAEYMWGIVPGRSMNSIPDLQKFQQVCLDTSYLYGKKLDLMRAYELIKKYLVHVHLSQVLRGKEHSFPTTGIMPLESFLTRLGKDSYSGSISLLVKPKELMVGNDEKCLALLTKARKFCEKYY
jgi:sugar phosphate isomerase/epimerase